MVSITLMKVLIFLNWGIRRFLGTFNWTTATVYMIFIPYFLGTLMFYNLIEVNKQLLEVNNQLLEVNNQLLELNQALSMMNQKSQDIEIEDKNDLAAEHKPSYATVVKNTSTNNPYKAQFNNRKLTREEEVAIANCVLYLNK